MIFIIVYFRTRSDKVLRGIRDDLTALHLSNLLVVELGVIVRTCQSTNKKHAKWRFFVVSIAAERSEDGWWM